MLHSTQSDHFVSNCRVGSSCQLTEFFGIHVLILAFIALFDTHKIHQDCVSSQKEISPKNYLAAAVLVNRKVSVNTGDMLCTVFVFYRWQTKMIH